MASVTARDGSRGVRYDVQWRLPDGTKRKRTFTRRKDAENFMKKLSGEEIAGLVIDPNSGDIPFGPYAARWIETRLVKGRPLAPASKRAYRELLRTTLADFDNMPLRGMQPEEVRRWYSTLVQEKGPDRAAKGYRLLRAVMNSAVRDRRIAHSPCLIEGGGQYEAPERPMVETGTVLQLASAIDERFQALILLIGFVGLRPEETLALRRSNVDLLHAKVTVSTTVQEIHGMGQVEGPPKSEAGRRTVALPRVVVEALDRHLAHFAEEGRDCLGFG